MEAPLLLPIAAIADDSSIVAGGGEEHSSASSSSSPSTHSIVARVVAVLAVASVSLFAQHEASKGFRIDVVNAAPRGTLAGRRFDLFFVSNGEAARVLHRASRCVERALFPDASFPRKRVTRVTVRMEDGRDLNLTSDAATVAAASAAAGEYVISLNPSLMSSSGAVTAAAVRRAVARMWLWDGRGAAPAHVTESIVEYLAATAGGEDAVEATSSAAAASKPPQCMSARFLSHLERRRGGFVARLNRAMRDRWSDAAVDAALGAPSRPLCAAYLAAGQVVQLPPCDSTSDVAGSRVAAT